MVEVKVVVLDSMDDVLEDILNDQSPINHHKLGSEPNEVVGGVIAVIVNFIEDFSERKQILVDVVVAFDLLQPVQEDSDCVVGILSIGHRKVICWIGCGRSGLDGSNGE